jgi:nitrate reductase delta subunit
MLLAYPDDDLDQRLPLLVEVVPGLPLDTRVPLETFLDHLEATARTDAHEHYVATFDMRRKCCPFLTYWTHGDTRNRGMALLRFKQTYRDSGVIPPEDELPDHLAVVLEFAATGDQAAGNQLLGEHRAPIELLRDALQAADSPYAHVLDAVVATLPPMTEELAERARELAAAGPPTELVGIGGPVDITISTYPAASQDLMGARR